MTPRFLLPLTVLAGLAIGVPATAQPVSPSPREQQPPGASAPRLFVFVGAGQRLTTRTFGNGAAFRVNAEDARFDSTYEVGPDLFFKVNGGYLFGGHFGLGAAVTRFSTPAAAAVTASIPHPFFFRKPRTIEGTATGLERQERSIDLHLLASTTLGSRLQVTIFGGPSFVQVRQDLATSATFTEVYPYDEASFAGTTTMGAKASASGFNAGGNVAFLLTRHLGVGADVQFSHATVELSDGTASRVKVDAGGVHVSGGVRLAF